ncbi:MAG: flagellar protein FlgN [Oscillibacter sp.]|nr:flagellar protein FlgN [Oscillibacter sp.]
MDAALWKKYLTLLDGLGETLEKLTEVERTKTQAVSRGDLEAVEECMKQEQVISLSLRGTDQKRDRMLAQLGLTGVHLRDLAEHAPAELAMETKAAAERLRRKYEVFQSASEVARNTLECNLRAIERLQKAQEEALPEDPSRKADFRA